MRKAPVGSSTAKVLWAWILSICSGRRFRGDPNKPIPQFMLKILRKHHLRVFEFDAKLSLHYPLSSKRKAETSRNGSRPLLPDLEESALDSETPPPESEVDDVNTKCPNLPSFDPEALHIRPIDKHIVEDVSKERRIVRIKDTIATALTRAGMTDPSEKLPIQLPKTSEPGLNGLARRQALFDGSFGQVRQALADAGLEAVVCERSGVENAVRIGTLFVAELDSNGRPMKMVLWA